MTLARRRSLQASARTLCFCARAISRDARDLELPFANKCAMSLPADGETEYRLLFVLVQTQFAWSHQIMLFTHHMLFTCISDVVWMNIKCYSREHHVIHVSIMLFTWTSCCSREHHVLFTLTLHIVRMYITCCSHTIHAYNYQTLVTYCSQVSTQLWVV